MDDVINATGGLDDKTRSAIARLMDIKVESEMQPVLAAIHNEFKLLNSKFEQIDNRFEQIESKISTGYTIFGIACGVITIVLAAIGIIIAFK